MRRLPRHVRLSLRRDSLMGAHPKSFRLNSQNFGRLWQERAYLRGCHSRINFLLTDSQEFLIILAADAIVVCLAGCPPLRRDASQSDRPTPLRHLGECTEILQSATKCRHEGLPRVQLYRFGPILICRTGWQGNSVRTQLKSRLRRRATWSANWHTGSCPHFSGHKLSNRQHSRELPARETRSQS